MSILLETEDILDLLDRNGWSTVAFRRPLDVCDWPPELRPAYQTLKQQQQQQQRQEAGVAHGSPPPATTVASAIGPHVKTDSLVRISDVVAREAYISYGKIRKHIRHTPLEPSPWLSSLVGSGCGAPCTALLKLESEQHTGSFKVRGALSKLLSLSPEILVRDVFTASTGNHALAVLYACKALSKQTSNLSAAVAAESLPTGALPAILTQPAAAGTSASVESDNKSNQSQAYLHAASAAAKRCGDSLVAAQAGTGNQCLISGMRSPSRQESGIPESRGGEHEMLLRPQLYVPTTASLYKVRKLRSLGADLHMYGTDCLEAELAARAAAADAGAVYISPYNDPWVMAGQGTIGLELLAARHRGKLDVVLVPVGGGGLIGGVASVLKAANSGIQVVGCQPAASNVMARSVEAGVIVAELSDTNGAGGYTLSDATAGGVEYGSATLQPCIDCVDEWMTVTEAEIAEALVGLLEEQSKLVEGAAACALAAFKRMAPRLTGKSVVVICCGGNIAVPSLMRAIGIAKPEVVQTVQAHTAVSSGCVSIGNSSDQVITNK